MSTFDELTGQNLVDALDDEREYGRRPVRYRRTPEDDALYAMWNAKFAAIREVNAIAHSYEQEMGKQDRRTRAQRKRERMDVVFAEWKRKYG